MTAAFFHCLLASDQVEEPPPGEGCPVGRFALALLRGALDPDPPAVAESAVRARSQVLFKVAGIATAVL